MTLIASPQKGNMASVGGGVAGGAGTIYVEPPGTQLAASPLFFGMAGDSIPPSAVPQAYIADFQPGPIALPDYKVRRYEPPYQKQVSANWANNGAPNNIGLMERPFTIQCFGWPISSPQYNLLQPLPYWNVRVVSAQQLAAYESLAGNTVTQVPADYVAAGPPNLYLGS